MKFVNAFPFLVIGASWGFVSGAEVSNEGVGAHHRRSEVRPKTVN
jgi:hypothetical protein